MLTREVFCSIVFDLACVWRFAVAKPPYDLRTYHTLCVNVGIGHGQLLNLQLDEGQQSTHSRHQGMNLGFPIPVIGKVSKTIKLLLRSE